jgi:hypothetical protein
MAKYNPFLSELKANGVPIQAEKPKQDKHLKLFLLFILYLGIIAILVYWALTVIKSFVG